MQLEFAETAKERRKAEFSPDRRHRYTLQIIWQHQDPWWQPNVVQFIGLNPSTADEVVDDNTVRRCKDFARRWGFDGMVMTNLFTFRATDPHELFTVSDPVAREADQWLAVVAGWCQLRIAAWGVHGTFQGRDRDVRGLLRAFDLHCLGYTKEGLPRHPLYLPKTSTPIPFV